MDGVNICTGISCSLSIFGSSVIFWSYWKKPNFRNDTTKLLLFLTVADLMNATGNLTGAIRFVSKYGHRYDFEKYTVNGTCVDSTDVVCIAQSFVTTFASLASFWWTFHIALHHFLLVYRRESCLPKLPGQIWCHLSGWLIPCTVAVFAISQNVLGEDMSVSSGPWCWIKTCNPRLMSPVRWMALTGKGWEITAYFTTGALYILLKVATWRQNRRPGGFETYNQEPNESLDEETKEFGLLWLILYFYLSRMWGTVRYLIYAVEFERSDWIAIENGDWIHASKNILMYFQSIGDSSQAFINFFIVCKAWQRIARCLKCVREENMGSEREALITKPVN